MKQRLESKLIIKGPLGSTSTFDISDMTATLLLKKLEEKVVCLSEDDLILSVTNTVKKKYFSKYNKYTIIVNVGSKTNLAQYHYVRITKDINTLLIKIGEQKEN